MLINKNDILKQNELLQEELNKMKSSIKNFKKYGIVWEDYHEKMIDIHYSTFNLKDSIINKTDGKSKNHLIIEGNDLISLKSLYQTNREDIDIIYIDPPSDMFLFNEEFISQNDGWHNSKWLSFMENRLKLSYKLLNNNGVIFISVNDDKLYQLKLLCDEIFGSNNFISNIVWKKNKGHKLDSKFLINRKEYILVYRKKDLKSFISKSSNESRYKLEDEKGKYELRVLSVNSLLYNEKYDYIIQTPKNENVYAGYNEDKWKKRKNGEVEKKDSRWVFSKEEFDKRLSNNEIIFKETKDNQTRIYYKSYFLEAKSYHEDLFIENIKTGTKEMKEIFDDYVYDSKPLNLIKWLINLYPKKNIKVLDFFADSGVTGHAVLELNKEDKGTREFILITYNDLSKHDEIKLFIKNNFIKKTPSNKSSKEYKDWKESITEFKKTNKYKEYRESKEFKENIVSNKITLFRIKKYLSKQDNLFVYQTIFNEDYNQLFDKLNTIIYMKYRKYHEDYNKSIFKIENDNLVFILNEFNDINLFLSSINTREYNEIYIYIKNEKIYKKEINESLKLNNINMNNISLFKLIDEFNY